MNTVKINVPATRGYDVIIGRGLLARSGEYAAAVKKPCRAAVVSDDTVFELYGGQVMKSLEGAGFSPFPIVFPHGEQSKNLTTLGSTLEAFAAAGLTRSDVVFALGGGVVGDLAGFAAACYLRGVDFIQLPTTLLAAVDSSVGGKTAVDLAAGKNLAGAFHNPVLVLCDPDTLQTLDAETFSDGMAEVIKYGVISDAELFNMLECGVGQDNAIIIERCVKIKRDFVAEDEFDRGMRKILNFGHTIGHAIEKNSGYGETHGRAVAAGMVMAARIAEKIGFCRESVSNRLICALKAHNLPTGTSFGAAALAQAALRDKKAEGGRLTLILPRKIGRCEPYEIASNELERYISLGYGETGGERHD